jgi:hypothetical protein
MARFFVSVLTAILLYSTSVAADPPGRTAAATDDACNAEVLEVMLIDLLSMKDSPVEPLGRAKEIYFSTEPLRAIRAQLVKDFFSATAIDREAFSKLSKADLARAMDAADDMVGRAITKDVFKPFKPKDARIKMYTKEKAKADEKWIADVFASKAPARGGADFPPLWGRQVFRAFSPGYSRDKQIAVVSLHFGWSGNFHGAEGRYVLVKRDGKWIVLAKNLIYFL